MSEQEEATIHRSPESVARVILEAVKKEFGSSPCPDCLRMGLGLSLSSVHSTIIAETHKRGQSQDGIDCVIDSVQRLLGSMQGTVEALGIGSVEFEIVPTAPPDTQKKSHESNVNLH